MKICFINTTLFGTDGISRVLSCLASELSKRHDVTVITFEKEGNVDKKRYNISPAVKVLFWEPIYKKCKIRRTIHKLNQKTGILKRLNSKAAYDWTYLPKHMQKKWIEYINKEGFDAVVGVQGKGAYILGSIKEHVRCKTIGWQHNSYEAYLENKGLYYWNQDYLFETYIKKLDHYVVLNEHDEEMYRTKKRMETITIYNPKSFESSKKSSCTNKRFIGVGGLRPAKGFDYAIEAFELFSKENLEWKLDIFGEGEDRGKLQQLIDEKKLNGLVTLKGTTKQIQEELIESGVFLLPSRWEGMPMAVLEALEIGVPTISFDISAIHPLVSNEIEGLVVEKFDIKAFADAMTRMATDNELRMQCSRNAIKKARLFDVKSIAEQWEKMLAD